MVPIEGLAVLVVCLSIDTPLHALGLVYNGLVFRSLYGNRREVVGAFLAYAGRSFIGAVALSVVGRSEYPYRRISASHTGLDALVWHLLFRRVNS